MLLSKSCEYGLRAMLYLSSRLESEADGASESGSSASAPVHAYVPLQTVSDDLSIGPSYLTKVCQQLNAAGLLTSKRGRGGGIALTQAPDAISLYEIVVAIDGDDLFEECVLGLPGCGEAEPCPLHDHWTEERERMRTTFQDTSLAEVPNVRLTPFVGGDSDLAADASAQ
jgi:Rrf2 family protein